MAKGARERKSKHDASSIQGTRLSLGRFVLLCGGACLAEFSVVNWLTLTVGLITSYLMFSYSKLFSGDVTPIVKEYKCDLICENQPLPTNSSLEKISSKVGVVTVS